MVMNRYKRGASFFLLSLLLSISCFHSPQVIAAACSDIFSNGMQAHASNGNVNLGYHSQITGGGSTLASKTLTDNSALLACSGSSCAASGIPSTSSTVTFQTGTGSNGAINIPYQGSQNAASGDYGTVDVAQEASLKFNTNSGLYYTKAFTTGYRSEVWIRTGDYWIDGNLTLGQETVLRRLAAAGSTRIFVRGNVSIGYKVSTDSFTSDQLLIYATGTITTNQFINMSAFLYAGGNVTLDYGVVINGAVAGANVSSTAGQATVNYQGSALSLANFAPLCSGVSTAPVLLGSWRMDERLWDGTANEVVDSSGNANHGRARIANGSTSLPTTASGSPAYTSGNQNTCYYGSFDSTSSPVRTYSYVELTGFPTLPNGFTFAAWIRSTNASAQHQRILVRDDAQNGWGLSLADGTGQPKLRFFARNITNNGAVTGQGTNPSCGVFCLDTNAVITSNAWYYVASSVDTTAKTVTLYVYNQSGVLQAKTSGAYSGTWTDGTGTAAIGGETSASSEGTQTSWHFLGNIDEVNIYSGALSQTSIESLLTTVRTCSGPDHYEVEIASASVACEGASVTVRACANSLIPCTQDLSVNTNATLATTAGSLNATTLTLSAGQATTKLLYPAAADGATATLTLSNEQTAAINSRKCCTGSSNCTVANSCSTTFKTAGFIFANNATTSGNIPTQIAGTTDNSVYLRAVKTNTTTGACVARFTSPQTVQLAYQCVNPTTCVAGQSLTLAGTAVQSNANSVVPASISYTNASLTFDVNGSAAIPFNYTDVGQVHLLARLALSASGGEPAYTLTGTSNDFVVKPHSLAVSAVTNTSNVANPGTTTAGTGFVAAGEKFKVSLQARNAAGNPTPNFGNEVVSEKNNMTLTANSLVYPTGGTLTALTNGGTFTATTPAGTFINTDILWNQVGSMTLVGGLGDNDYLGVGNISNFIQSSTVGRFYPDHYRLTASTTAEACGAFSYMGQPNIGVSYTVQAESLSGVVLSNYDNTDQATFYTGVATPNYVAENLNGGNGATLSPRVFMPSVTWNDGALTLNTTAAEFGREITFATPDGPYTSLQLGLSLTDALDSRTLNSRNMNATTTGTCSGASCNAITLGSTLNLLYGRLHLEDAFGPETAALPVNFTTEYWTGSFYAKNTNDSCTALLKSAITYPNGNLLTAANLTVPLSGGSTTGVYGTTTPTQIRFAAGDALHYFQAPGANATGSFDVNVDLTAYDWLRFDWNQDNDYNNDTSLPTARFGFGSYRGNDRIIYWREKLQ